MSISFSCGGRDVDMIKVCEDRPRVHALMHGCRRRDLRDVPRPFVWMPDLNELPIFDCATYEEINGESGSYELEWLSWREV